MTKTCIRCKQTKLIERFGKSKTSIDKHRNVCKDCRNLYAKSWYNQNKEVHVKRVYTNKLHTIKSNRQNLYNYLKDHPCIDCGNSNPIVLEFDHIKEKRYNISEMMSLSWNSIINEISKCVVRCANCHRIKTALESNWYKDILT